MDDLLTIDEVLEFDDAQSEIVSVPEWDGRNVRVCSITAAERATIEKIWVAKQASSDPEGFRVDLLAMALKKPDGSPFATVEQVRQLMGKNSAAIERLFNAAIRLCGFSQDDVKELEKN